MPLTPHQLSLRERVIVANAKGRASRADLAAGLELIISHMDNADALNREGDAAYNLARVRTMLARFQRQSSPQS